MYLTLGAKVKIRTTQNDTFIGTISNFYIRDYKRNSIDEPKSVPYTFTSPTWEITLSENVDENNETPNYGCVILQMSDIEQLTLLKPSHHKK